MLPFFSLATKQTAISPFGQSDVSDVSFLFSVQLRGQRSGMVPLKPDRNQTATLIGQLAPVTAERELFAFWTRSQC